jgi:toxin ParE1/3/4
MSSSEVTHYRLTPLAEEDLENIWRYTAETWSTAQADRYIDELVVVFEMLVAVPEAAHERDEFDPPVRIHSHARQLVVYLIKDDHLAILRVLGGGQDWEAILGQVDG